MKILKIAVDARNKESKKMQGAGLGNLIDGKKVLEFN